MTCPNCGAENPAGNRYCGHCGTALARRGLTGAPSLAPAPTGSEGERRQVTVLICDLVGSTALSARLDPEDMREVIAAYHRCCAEAIARNGGFVAKYMGDGVLAYFGYPQAHEDDAERAVRGALALIEAVRKLRTGHDAKLQVRIGVATGVVVIADDLAERTAVGETPNLASRLQALAEPGRVVISQSTRRLIGGLFEYRDLGAVALKGFAEPVCAYQVLGISRVASRFHARRDAKLTPLIGREEELALLQRRWRQACAGDGRVVLISGEPGIGKSRLAVALQDMLASEPHARLHFYCSPHHTESALYPMINQLERGAGFERTDPPAERLAKLEAVVGPEARDMVALFADLLSLPTDGRYRLPEMSPQKRKDRTLAAFLQQLQSLAAQQPVLMILEDAHWIDPTTFELLEMAIETVAVLRVLLVVTHRPEFQPPSIGQAHVTLLTLNRLGPRERMALVEQVVGDKALSDELAAEIAERADGIPLFVEELTKAVLEAGGGEGEAKQIISAAPRPRLVVPATLQASLMARLDRLGPAAKEIAQIGAAIGREFSYPLLAAVAQQPDAALRSALDRFSDAGLIFSRGVVPEATFLFKHALVRDAAYGTLLRRQRQQLHGRIAAVLEREFPALVKTQPELLAHHCAEAGLAPRAIEFYLVAAKRAIAASSNNEAIGHLTKGLALVELLPAAMRRSSELRLRFTMSEPLIQLKGYGAPEVEAGFARSRELCLELGDSPELFHSLYGLWGYHLLRARLTAASELSAELLGLGPRLDDSHLRLAAHHTATVTAYWTGRLTSVPQHSDQELQLYDPERQRGRRTVASDAVIDSLGHCAFALWALGFPDRACDKSATALALARRINNPFGLCSAMNWHAYLHYFRREPARVTESLGVLSAVAREHGFAFWSLSADIWQVWYEICVMDEHRADGIDRFRAAHAGLRALGADLAYAPNVPMLVDCLAAEGRIEEAAEALVDALADIARMGQAVLEPQLLCLLGDMLRRQDGAALDRAESAYRQAIDVARCQSARMWELRAATALAQLWQDCGRGAEALALLAPIHDGFSEGFDTRDLQDARGLLGRLG
ncbi:MAG TPA: adenylate/guanylate cyclase domain-containing protein [Stellaceae bacterium]|nr:adenylate/guanylate cyclase domain-containing protein [Stellaceae bacterium]